MSGRQYTFAPQKGNYLAQVFVGGKALLDVWETDDPAEATTTARLVAEALQAREGAEATIRSLLKQERALHREQEVKPLLEVLKRIADTASQHGDGWGPGDRPTPATAACLEIEEWASAAIAAAEERMKK